MFKSIIREHSEMLLNPFFELFERPDDEFESYDDEEGAEISGNAKYLDRLKQRIDEVAVFYDKYF